ncbi:hypothetical protein BDBG_02413 [Blastomyces gilchristii SLH14081]|uniref:LYR motif-containing protein 2 n=1 Tax=Blastomyces gilchristii (strain SLH14081) TaxID=559298 RepID=A0A179UEG4_BLAGS|nr:uncharacterized protein BDBG_02413 [Blastomyces gilchristii SLH14081]OAT06133.1 hypothetical protein BDBG_02413 [Blastomyces gilchristii SLH14081]
MAEKPESAIPPIFIHALVSSPFLGCWTAAAQTQKANHQPRAFRSTKASTELWREIVRATNRIPKSSARDEMRSFARHEFERSKDVTDLTHIRYLISTGKTEFDAMRRYIDELAA